jgi:glycosyltransferase involved in cell wall biosynthesis
VPQEIKKQTIVIASVLKPVDDTRAFEKMATSLASHGQQVFIIGYPGKTTDSGHPLIQFLPLATFKRLSFARVMATLWAARKIHQVKPDVLIVNTHELLIVAILNRILFGTKILYDVQENYAQNILSTDAFPRWIRSWLAAWVRLKERVTAPLFHHFLLAEKSYEKELFFMGKNYSVVENKARIPKGFKRTPDPQKLKLIFTGTLAENTGVFQAINLAKRLHELDAKVELEIIGFCAQQSTLKRLKQSIEKYSYIKLIGGTELVPHTRILESIASANFGIISYPMLPYLKNKMPTKLYEYLGLQLPFLLTNNRQWVNLAIQFDAAVVIEFGQIDATRTLEAMRTRHFYSQDLNLSNQISWEAEEMKLVSAVTGPRP